LPQPQPGPAIKRGKEINLTAGAVTEILDLDVKPLPIVKEVAENSTR
jgi:hypothetical protein